MQMVKRLIGGFFLSILLLWLLSPKQELYYFLEKELKKEGIIISNEKFTDRWYGFIIEDADIYVKGAKMVQVSKLELNIFFIYNVLKIEKIETNDAIHNVAPKQIEEAEIQYSILNPLKVDIDAKGSFGVAKGEVKLLDREVKILFPVVKDIKVFRKFLKKDKTEGWKYETNY
jgi:hypothetical protein